MTPTNYFKAAARRRVEQVFAFNGAVRLDALLAFERATVFAAENGARVSVCYPVPTGGPWGTVPIILEPPAAPAPAAPRRLDEPARGLALFGEGGCW